ncbi:MAG: DUF1311 domain-containing protein [Gammaproteobacteria bacterium]|nr:DUF1311 domain-containing protein [Gammaproteobacteria bacterium]
MEQDRSEDGVLACLVQAYEKWDIELNKVYRTLRRELSPKQKIALRDAERLWIKYRDAEFDTIEAMYGRLKGNRWKQVILEMQVNIVKTRTLDLQNHLDTKRHARKQQAQAAEHRQTAEENVALPAADADEKITLPVQAVPAVAEEDEVPTQSPPEPMTLEGDETPARTAGYPQVLEESDAQPADAEEEETEAEEVEEEELFVVQTADHAQGNGTASEDAQENDLTAEADDASAQLELADRYKQGNGVVQDFGQAAYWYRKAAEQGLAEAQYKLGVMHYKGKGVSQDSAQAAQWFQKAAEQEVAKAQFKLGWMYEHSKGMAEDFFQSAHWYQKAAQQGHTAAQYNLGVMYTQGRGVERNLSLAAEFYQKAAKKGHIDAQYNLGVLYYEGKGGVTQDYKQAAYWTRKAAEQGFANAQYNLGMMSQHGQGEEQNLVQAYLWFSLSAAQGDQMASDARDQIKARLSRRQIGDGEDLVRQWQE